jgi:hypothetical protein
MIPDFEYFLRLNTTSIYSHTWLGLFWFDLPLGFLVYLVYERFVQDVLIDNLPVYLNRRFSFARNTEGRLKAPLPVLMGSLLIGAASHLFWDGFTHWRGIFVPIFPFLEHWITIGHTLVKVQVILQHMSSVAGLIIISVFVARMKPRDTTVLYRNRLFWPIVLFTVVFLLVLKFWLGMRFADYGTVIVVIVSGFLSGLLIAAVFCGGRKMPQIPG